MSRTTRCHINDNLDSNDNANFIGIIKHGKLDFPYIEIIKHCLQQYMPPVLSEAITVVLDKSLIKMKNTHLFKKSQWFDLLFAYGWAILLIALSLLSFLYFGLLREGNIVDAACEFPSGLSCIDAPKANATLQTISFRLVNTLGFSITEMNATSKGNANCQSLNTSSPVIADTTVVAMTLLNCSIEEAIKFEDDVTITFVNAETKQKSQKIGKIIGRAE